MVSTAQTAAIPATSVTGKLWHARSTIHDMTKEGVSSWDFAGWFKLNLLWNLALKFYFKVEQIIFQT